MVGNRARVQARHGGLGRGISRHAAVCSSPCSWYPVFGLRLLAGRGNWGSAPFAWLNMKQRPFSPIYLVFLPPLGRERASFAASRERSVGKIELRSRTERHWAMKQHTDTPIQTAALAWRLGRGGAAGGDVTTRSTVVCVWRGSRRACATEPQPQSRALKTKKHTRRAKSRAASSEGAPRSGSLRAARVVSRSARVLAPARGARHPPAREWSEGAARARSG